MIGTRAVLLASSAVLAVGAHAQETTSFTYDAQGRLIGSTRSGGPADGVAHASSYDKAGNRTSYAVTGVSSPPPPPPPPPPPNSPPVAVDDVHDASGACPSGSYDVTVNDSDPDAGDTITVTSASGAGFVSITGGTTITYSGIDPFLGTQITYTLSDNHGATDTAVLTVSCVTGL